MTGFPINSTLMLLIFIVNMLTVILAAHYCGRDSSRTSTIQDDMLVSATSAKLFNWPGGFGGYDYSKSPPQTNYNQHHNYPMYNPVTPWYNIKQPNYTPPSLLHVNLPPLKIPPLNVNGLMGTNILGGNGNGGYGGYGGNGGLSQYDGYWKPDYQGQRNRGYGYYSNTNFFGLPKAINYNNPSDNANKDRPQYSYRGYD